MACTVPNCIACSDDREKLDMYELERDERREIEGELLRDLEAKGYEIVCHDPAKTRRCFSCTLSRIVASLPEAPRA